MSGVVKQAEEGPASGDGGVKTTQEDEGRNHEGEGDLLVQGIQRSESWRSHVLASVDIHDSADNAENDDFGNGTSPKRLGKFTVVQLLALISPVPIEALQEYIPRIAHLCDKTGQSDLSNKGVADVEECSHAIDKGRVMQRKDVVLDGT